MFERLLVPVDGSEHALSALEYAVAIQEKFDSELLLLCVYRHYSRLEASMYVIDENSPEEIAESMRSHAKGVVDEAKNEAAGLGSKKLRGFVKSGPPARTIVNFAKDRNVSLIVLGSRGLGDVEGFLMGSVSHKVTSLSACPVMVV